MIQVDLAQNLEHGSMIPVDLEGKNRSTEL